MDTSAPRISIAARIFADRALKTPRVRVRVNTGPVLVLTRILLRFATHYYNSLYIILSGA